MRFAMRIRYIVWQQNFMRGSLYFIRSPYYRIRDKVEAQNTIPALICKLCNREVDNTRGIIRKKIEKEKMTREEETRCSST